MAEKPSHKVHPIVRRALELARYSPVGDIIFDDFAKAELQDMLDALHGKPELSNAVVDLLNLAGELEKLKSPTGALAIVILVSTAGDALQVLTKTKKN